MMKSMLLGAAGYPCLELLWRGRTHPSMALAGALGCAAICHFAKGQKSLWRQAFRGACAVTGIEYAAGLIFNRRHQIWDYRNRKGHVQGQICPEYFALWWLLSLAVVRAARRR